MSRIFSALLTLAFLISPGFAQRGGGGHAGGSRGGGGGVRSGGSSGFRGGGATSFRGGGVSSFRGSGTVGNFHGGGFSHPSGLHVGNSGFHNFRNYGNIRFRSFYYPNYWGGYGWGYYDPFWSDSYSSAPYDNASYYNYNAPPQDYYNSGYQQPQEPPQVIVQMPPAPDPREYQNPEPRQQYDNELFLIAFKDGNIRAVMAYWPQGTVLHYVTMDHEQKQAPLASVDRELSERLNNERHVTFRLPR